MQSAMKALVIIDLVDKITSPLNHIKKSVISFSDAIPILTKLGTKMTAVGIGVSALGTGFVQAAGQMESYKATLTNMFGGNVDMAKVRLKELSDIAATTPFELPQVVQAGNQLQAIGRYSKDALIGLGDMAANAGKPMEQAMSAYTKLATGQKGIAVDMFRDLLITTDDWVKATGKGVSATGSLMATTEEMLAVLPQILKNKNILGAMEAQSKTFGGVVSNFKDSIFQFMATFGDSLLEPAKAFISGITSMINAVKQFGEEHPLIAAAIMRIVGLIAVLLIPLGLAVIAYANWHKWTRNMVATKKLLSKVVTILTTDIWKNIAATKAGTAATEAYAYQMKLAQMSFFNGKTISKTTAGLKAITSGMRAFAGVILTSPITYIIIAIIALAAWIAFLVKSWDKMKKATISIFLPVIKQFYLLKSSLKGLLDIFKPITDAISKAFNFKDVNVSWNDLLYWIGFGIGFLMGLFERGLAVQIAYIIGLVNVAVTYVKNLVGGIIGGLMDIWGGIQKILSGDIIGGLKQIGVGILKVVTAPILAAINLVTGLVNNFTTMLNSIKIRIPKIGKFEGMTLGFNIPQIPQLEFPSFAKGVENFSGGLAYVHKDELISMPSGSNVHTKKEVRDMFKGKGGTGGTTIIKHYHIGKIEFNPDSIEQLKNIADIFSGIDREVTA